MMHHPVGFNKYIIKAYFFLGKDLALEVHLIFLKLSIVVLYVASPNHAFDVAVFKDIANNIPYPLIVLPFLVFSVAQAVGVAANCLGHEWNWMPRYFGAIGAIAMWSWILIKSISIDAYGFAIPITISAILSNLWIVWKSWNRLPIPGKLGASSV